jgi:hypothetical protein
LQVSAWSFQRRASGDTHKDRREGAPPTVSASFLQGGRSTASGRTAMCPSCPPAHSSLQLCGDRASLTAVAKLHGELGGPWQRPGEWSRRLGSPSIGPPTIHISAQLCSSAAEGRRGGRAEKGPVVVVELAIPGRPTSCRAPPAVLDTRCPRFLRFMQSRRFHASPIHTHPPTHSTAPFHGPSGSALSVLRVWPPVSCDRLINGVFRRIRAVTSATRLEFRR